MVLLISNLVKHDKYVKTFRKYAQGHTDVNERVRYTYVYEETQAAFVRYITKGAGITNGTDSNLKVINYMYMYMNTNLIY